MKSIKKRCGALLLAAVWMLWLLPTVSFAADMEGVYIDGKAWDGNAENGVSWDPLTATLTLTDAQLSWNQINFTDANETLTVRVNGENTITSPYCGIDTNGSMVVEMAEGASLTVVSESTSYHSLSATNDLTIKGGKYDLQAGGSGLYAGQNLTVEGGAEITAASVDAMAAICAYEGNVLLHDGSSVTVTSAPQAAVFARLGTVTVSGQGTHANLTATLSVLSGVAGVTVGDGAEVIGSTTGNSVAVYSVNGDIAIESGASVTILETPDAAFYAANGSVTISGQGTRANLTPTYNAANAKNNITIDDGAEVISSVSGDRPAFYAGSGDIAVLGGADVTVLKASSGLYAEAGTITVSGQDTRAEFTTTYGALVSSADITVDDGAEVIASVSGDAAVCYTAGGNISVLGGADVTIREAAATGLFAETGMISVSGQGTRAEITSTYNALFGSAGITVSDSAEVIASVSGDAAALYTGNGDISVMGGADVTILEGSTGLYAEIGSVTVSGQGTRAEITSTYNALFGSAGVTVGDGAGVTASVSDNAAAVYSSVGGLTVTGQGTTVHVTSQYCALRGNQSVTFSDGAVVVAETELSTVVYADNGPITLDHADATLNCADNGGAALMAGLDSNIQPITIQNSKLNADTPGSSVYAYDDIEITDSVLTVHSVKGAAIYTYGNIGIADSELTLRSENSNPINSKKDLTITGKGTVITATAGAPIIGNTVTIREANVACEAGSTATAAIAARADLIIADGADVTTDCTNSMAGLYTVNGMIDLEGADTRVEAVSGNDHAIIANGKIILNAGYVKATSAEGKAAIVARQTAEESPAERPEPQIEIGENYMAGGNMVATTVWQTDEDGQYYAETVLVPEDTQLNDQGLLDEGYLPTNIVEITPKQPPADKTALDEAIRHANEKLTEAGNYTDETVTALTDAVAKAQAVSEREDATQDEVNAAVKAIEDAITGLQYKAADYTAVDTALQKVPQDLSVYTDNTAQAVKDAVEAMEPDLPITEQARVDAMAKAIEDAVAGLQYKAADYTAVDAALAKVPKDLSGYTAETAKAVEDAVKAVERDLPITEQARVDAMAKAIEDTVAALKKAESPAVPGDIDGDGKVSVTDALAILRMAVGLSTPTANADMDGMNGVTVTDALSALRIAVGLA